MADDRERLDLLYDLGKRLASMQDADAVIVYATQRIQQFFQASGCSILLLDATRREFRFPVSAQGADATVSSEDLGRMRFPADRGIAGWVIDHEEGAWVADTSTDERFYRGIDAQTGTVTRSLICVPLRTVRGIVGVVEVINPVVGADPSDDVEFLSALSSDVGTAYEKADLQRRIRQEATELRYIGITVGVAMTLAGLAIAGFGALGHLARALPVGRLVVQPMVLLGLGVGASGLAVVLAVRRAVARRRIGH